MKNIVQKITKIEPFNYKIKVKEITVHTIKEINKLVRNSYEYKKFIYYIKNILDINHCSYYEGYSMKNGFTIELHHSPFTLQEISDTIARKHLQEFGHINKYKVAEEVTKLHYECLIGLVPLNPTAHELVHSGELDIHPDIILGHWNDFVTMYKKYFSPSTKNTYQECLNMQKKNKSDKFPKILHGGSLELELPDNIQRIDTVEIGKLLAHKALNKK